MVGKINKKPIFSRNIILRRKLKGWSVLDLAHKSGVGITTIKLIEAGRSRGQPATNEAIAEALDCTVEDLNQRSNGEKQFISGRDLASLIEPILSLGKVSQRRKSLILALVSSDASYLRSLSPAEARHAQSLLEVL